MIKKENVSIMSSKFGSISLSWDEGVVELDDGWLVLSEDKWREVCRIHADCGADATREMHWLVAEPDVWAAPFLWIEAQRKYNLDVLNQEFFDVLKQMNRIAKEYKLKLFYTLFDWCGVKKAETAKWNPWMNNIQHINGWWDKRAWPWVESYLQAVKKAGINYVDLFNEPPENQHMVMGEFLWREMRFVVDELHIPYEKIILGHQFAGMVWDRFQDFQKKASDNEEIKYRSYTPCHRFSDADTMAIVKGKYHRAVNPSFDGVTPRPDIPTTEMIVEKYLREAKSRRAIIEVLNCHDNGGYDNAAEGISRAYKNVYGAWPNNYDRFPPLPKPKPKPEPGPVPTPEAEEKPEEEKMELPSIPAMIWMWIKKNVLHKAWLWTLIGGFILGLIF